MKRFLLLTLSLFTLVIIAKAQEPMVLEFNTNLSDGTTITLPLQGTVNVTVNWGDGNEESFTSAGNIDHTYAEEGTYTVNISGALTQYGNSWMGYSNADKLVSVSSFGDLGLNNLAGAFRSASNLVSVPTILPAGITDMTEMFYNNVLFNSDISSWDVSNVTKMNGMFFNASIFNQDISGWNVGSVTSMRYMFYYAMEFNQDIGSWDVGNVTEMSNMFEGASSFDQNIGGWNVSNVTSMAGMFMPGMFNTVKLSPANYNSLLLGWSAQTLQSSVSFHAGTSKYSPDVATDARAILTNTYGWTINDGGSWNLPLLTTTEVTEILATTAKSGGNITANGGSEITARGVVWHTESSPTIENNLGFTADGSGNGEFESDITNLTPGETYFIRAYATNGNGTEYGQEIVFESSNSMVLIFDTNLSEGKTITLPLNSYVNVVVNWGDGTTNTYTSRGLKPHTYSNEGMYTVTIDGTMWWFGNESIGYDNADKLFKVLSFGNLTLKSLSGAFLNATNLIEVPNQIPVTVTNTSYMFKGASLFNGEIDNWDVSNVTTMLKMFNDANTFNQNIGDWNVEKVRDMSGMFDGASSFNKDIGNWNVSNVIDMSKMFTNAKQFNQDIGGWNTSKVNDMSSMFLWASAFNQNIGGWYTSSVIKFSTMFAGAVCFNQNIGDWDVSNCTGFVGMFWNAAAFNQDIGNWDVSNCIGFGSMFWDATAFNQDIGRWDVSNAQNMSGMFRGATSFNQDIGEWDVSNVVYMSEMFKDASLFNQDIGRWDVSKVATMAYMFEGASEFNQDIGRWDVSNVNDIRSMFKGASAFNQNIENWNVSNVEKIGSMFYGADAFNQNIGSWNVSNVTSMEYMFFSADSFNQNISSWNVGNVTTMEDMFNGALEFNQDIGNWDVNKVTNMEDMFSNVELSTAYYNSILIGWAEKILQNNIEFNGGNSKYSPGDAANARQYIIDTYGWTITDGGESSLPALTTSIVIEITPETAISGGTVTADGGFEITARGLVWHTEPDPTLGLNSGFTSEGTGLGNFSSNINGLVIGNTYYIRAYASNVNGTEYGNSYVFTAQQELSIGGEFSVLDKIYDGSQHADISSNNLLLNGIVSGHEDISILNITAEFDNKIAENDKTITLINVALTGSDTYKYKLSLEGAPVTTASIEPKEISLVGLIADCKVYDGTVSTTLSNSGTLSSILLGDNVLVDYSGLTVNFDNKNVGVEKDVTASGFVLSGTDEENYVLSNNSIALKADISARNLNIIEFDVNNKIYDGTTEVTGLSITDDRIEGDDLEFSYTAVFSDKNVGESKDVYFSNIEISDGLDINNYVLSTNTGSTTADISPKPLLLNNFTAISKVYDGTNEVVGASFSDDRVEGDNLAFSYSVGFVDKNVGESKSVNFTDFSIANGTDKDNYTLSTTSGTAAADITPRTLTLSDFTADNKEYDGTTSVTGTGFNDDRVEGDDLEFTFSAEYSDKHAAEGKNVNFTDISISDGTDKDNYVLASQTGAAVANITPRPLILSNFTADSKEYDGTTEVFGTGFTDDRIDGDNLEFTYSAQFSDKNVGESKEAYYSDIAISDGTDKDNYSLGSTEGNTTATITTKELTIGGSFTALDKEYDGSAAATIDEDNLTLLTPIEGDDIELLEIVIEFENAEVGTDKTVSIVSANTDGLDKNNYSLSLSNAPTATASITQPVGIPGTSLSDVNVYPNPFREVIHITSTKDINRVVITNILGKVLVDININQLTGNTITTNLPSGVYLVNIITKDGTRVVRKMICKK